MEEEYIGYKDITLEDEELARFFESSFQNEFGLLENEYGIIRDATGKIVKSIRQTNDGCVEVPHTIINNKFVGKIKPKNIQQRLALDLLYNQDITVKLLAGKFGAGKTLLMTAAAADLVAKGVYDKIIYIRNNIEVKDSKPIGHLPGGYNDKLMPFLMPLADKFGGVENLEFMISNGTVEPIHLGFIRGRDFRRAIVMCSEVENMTSEHMQLLISRIGEDSSLWLDGDMAQVDMGLFEKNSGMRTLIDRLKGNPLFGYVKLVKTERSKTAELADLLY